MSELKPCPFCGEKENIEIKKDEHRFNLRCNNCGATAHGMYDCDELIWEVWEGGEI